MARYDRYVGIDYSGAEVSTSSLKGLRIYLADRASEPIEIPPPSSPRKYWTRKGIAEWLIEVLSQDALTLVGIDHGFSFPLRYFEYHGLHPDWPAFLDDFQKHWPTDEDHNMVDFIRNGLVGNGAARTGSAKWRRITEERTRAKSVFHFDVQGSVAKSTHTGIPWLRRIRNEVGHKVHFWPFEGWEPLAAKSTLVEAYPALWNKSFAVEGRNPHQHDAYSIAKWLRQADSTGALEGYFQPALLPGEKAIAQVEGWIFGSM